ncbi:MAG: hypothetical protein ACR2GI_00700 [Thermomicrobiales bacterium]
MPGASLSVTDTVRGLCRQAVDNALRVFVLRNALKHGREIDDDLSRLDSARQLKDRFLVAMTFYTNVFPSHNPLEKAYEQWTPHLNKWNASVHGTPASSEVQKSEIQAARKICARLGEALA